MFVDSAACTAPVDLLSEIGYCPVRSSVTPESSPARGPSSPVCIWSSKNQPPIKHDEFDQCCINVAPASQSMAQHQISIGSASLVWSLGMMSSAFPVPTLYFLVRHISSYSTCSTGIVNTSENGGRLEV